MPLTNSEERELADLCYIASNLLCCDVTDSSVSVEISGEDVATWPCLKVMRLKDKRDSEESNIREQTVRNLDLFKLGIISKKTLDEVFEDLANIN